MVWSIVDMANRDKIEWILNGTYQAGTEGEFEAIHLYDPSDKIIAVFDKVTRKFVTTFDEWEVTELKKNRNFGGEESLLRRKNVTPLQSDMTMDTSPNLGFTPINSFESDVTNRTEWTK